MKRGRLVALYIFLGGVFVATCIQSIKTIPTLLIGRIILGYFIGVVPVLTGKIIDETAPDYLKGPLGGLIQLFITTGLSICFIYGLFDPEEDDLRRETRLWFWLNILPGKLVVFWTLLLVLIFRHDTPKYLASQKRIEELDRVLARLYQDKSQA